MKHEIDAEPGSEEFRRAFLEIRNGFLAKLDEHIEGWPEVPFRACDSDGKPFRWVWDMETFRNEHQVGALNDARGYLAHMIDQGMHVAFRGVQDGELLEVWLTAWESPQEGPVWPEAVDPIFEEIHEGVTLRRLRRSEKQVP